MCPILLILLGKRIRSITVIILNSDVKIVNAEGNIIIITQIDHTEAAPALWD